VTPFRRRLATTVSAALLAGAASAALAPSAHAAVQVGRDSAWQAFEDSSEVEVEAPRAGHAKEANAELAKLAASAEQAVAEILENAWQLPIAQGVYRLTAEFGQCSSLWSHCHTGLDFAAPEGTPIVAIANGVITETGWAGAYGNRTVMTLEDGTELWFCHQAAFEARTGDQVVGGQVIGYVGSTGNSTGPHMHLEVRPGGGDAVDPKQALIVHGLTP
jgi:murein DD-endopeptidase MepM/ murein hydrolase activator NlpD